MHFAFMRTHKFFQAVLVGGCHPVHSVSQKSTISNTIQMNVIIVFGVVLLLLHLLSTLLLFCTVFLQLILEHLVDRDLPWGGFKRSLIV